MTVALWNELHIFYKQPHFRVGFRVAIKIPKIFLGIINIFGIEAKVAKLLHNFSLECMEKKAKIGKIDESC